MPSMIFDFGHASKVKYHINLRDEKTFKYRSRPKHLKDYEVLRLHLQTLFHAWVICESESLSSSPIVVFGEKIDLASTCPPAVERKWLETLSNKMYVISYLYTLPGTCCFKQKCWDWSWKGQCSPHLANTSKSQWGLAGYYSSWAKDYSRTVKPLNNLIGGLDQLIQDLHPRRYY